MKQFSTMLLTFFIALILILGLTSCQNASECAGDLPTEIVCEHCI